MQNGTGSIREITFTGVTLVPVVVVVFYVNGSAIRTHHYSVLPPRMMKDGVRILDDMFDCYFHTAKVLTIFELCKYFVTKIRDFVTFFIPSKMKVNN